MAVAARGRVALDDVDVDLDRRVVDARHLELLEVVLGDPARGERKELLDGVGVADKRDHLAVG